MKLPFSHVKELGKCSNASAKTSNSIIKNTKITSITLFPKRFAKPNEHSKNHPVPTSNGT